MNQRLILCLFVQAFIIAVQSQQNDWYVTFVTLHSEKSHCAKKWRYPMRKRQQIRRKTPGNISGGFVDVLSSDNTIFSRSESSCQTSSFYDNAW